MSKNPPLVLEDWIDRDLTAAAEAGELNPAFEVAVLVEQAEELLGGRSKRSPVFVGPPGVGKTAVVHELVRRAVNGDGAQLLQNSRVLQFSLRAISSRFTDKAQAHQQFSDICDAILTSPAPIVAYIRDVHLAYAMDWEPTLYRFLDRLPHGIIGEAAPNELESLLEYWSDLDALIVPIPLEEPSMRQVMDLVDQWSSWRATQGSPLVDEAARRTAIELTARYMGDRPFPRKVVDLLGQTVDLAVADQEQVGVPDVVRRFSQLTKVPRKLVDPAATLDLTEVRDFVAERLLGQDEAVDAVVKMIALIKAGLADLRRPFGAFLFVGPTGVGKTHCAQLLAEYLFGSGNRTVRINMADYAEADDAGTLFGRPWANRPRDQRGELAHRLRGHPFGVLLLDEFEKAHQSVHDRFLQLLDEGRYINGRGETVSATSLIIVATSNAGAELFRSIGLGFDKSRDAKEMDREIERRLARTFRFELLNRFDRVVHFHPLERKHIRAIARRELAELAGRDGLRARELNLEVDNDVLDWLVAHGYHPHFGARFLRREIERTVASTLAEFVVREMPPKGSRIALGVRRDRVIARMVRRIDDREIVHTEEGPKRLTRTALIKEGIAWGARFAPLQAEAAERVQQASKLIETSAGRGFWDDPDRAQEVLRRYKVLDARIQVEKRLLKPVRKLTRLMEHTDDSVHDDLGVLVSDVATSYRRWLELGVPTSPDGVWMLLGPADSLGSNSEWLVDLVAMYRSWLRRKGHTYEVAAEEVVGGEVTRLVIEVEGAGAMRLLEMEDGEHRRKNPKRGIDRARVSIIPRRESATGDVEVPGGKVEDARRGRGVAVPRRTARLTLSAPRRGLDFVLHGGSRETLQLLGRDLGGLLATPEGPGDVAREYGLTGGAVRDPRTSATVASIKDVQRGDLEPFLSAWEAR